MRNVKDYEKFVSENFVNKLSFTDNFGTGDILYEVTKMGVEYCLTATGSMGITGNPMYFQTIEEVAKKIWWSYFGVYEDIHHNSQCAQSYSREELVDRLFSYAEFYPCG